jgi:hypothetical protein
MDEAIVAKRDAIDCRGNGLAVPDRNREFAGGILRSEVDAIEGSSQAPRSVTTKRADGKGRSEDDRTQHTDHRRSRVCRARDAKSNSGEDNVNDLSNGYSASSEWRKTRDPLRKDLLHLIGVSVTKGNRKEMEARTKNTSQETRHSALLGMSRLADATFTS